MTSPLSGTPEHFDAIVVGSGFGGSVTAARLAEADWRVCVLERGKDYPPMSFPRSPLGIKRNFWDPSEGLHGMFDVWSFNGIDAICASGLGGGSLIYANVFLRKDERWFVKEDLAHGGYENWPVTRAELDPHYDRVEARVGVQQFPLDQSPYDRTPKVLAYREAAERLKEQGSPAQWSLAPLAVTFANAESPAVPGEPIREAGNLHERTRTTCQLCGECDIGCNYGAKNTLDYNFLTDAWNANADLRTRCEVRSFEPADSGGYLVRYVRHEPEAEGHPTKTAELPLHTLSCRHLILSAGTLGTTWLMLRNSHALPGLSRSQLGLGFSGNGDLLTFALRCSQRGPDGKREPRIIEAPRGPVITSAIRMPDARDTGAEVPPEQDRGFYLEDAGYPQAVSWVLEALEEPKNLIEVIARDVRSLLHHPRHRHSEIGGVLANLLGDCELSSTLFPLLGMGRDVPSGKMSLGGERLELDFSKDGPSRSYFDRVRAYSREIAEELGGEFRENPMWYEDRVITVHSLGGCRMGRSEHEGVVDPYGRVYGQPGLHIADGSVMPGPVGANPSLTIAALADRFADAILAEPG
jgi:cholesterol oxidase